MYHGSRGDLSTHEVERRIDAVDVALAVLHRRGRMRVWCGVFRERGNRALGAEVAARLARVIPAVRDVMRAADLTRYGRADQGTVQVLFETFDQPCWLVTKRGTIAFANKRARDLGRTELGAVRRAAAVAGDPRYAVSRISIDKEGLALVIGHARALPNVALPPSLARVADAIANGWSDKQIAAALELPLVTVRTYVRRCYERLGVHSRVELVAVWRAPMRH